MSTKNESLSTISVIHFKNGELSSITSFSDMNGGVKQAQKVFKDKINQYKKDYTDDNLEIFLDNGYFDDESSGFAVYIVHSSTVTEFMDN